MFGCLMFWLIGEYFTIKQQSIIGFIGIIKKSELVTVILVSHLKITLTGDFFLSHWLKNICNHLTNI